MLVSKSQPVCVTCVDGISEGGRGGRGRGGRGRGETEESKKDK